MVTKNQINLIRQIKRKRNRREKKLFIVEGKKSIDEFLSSNYKLHEIYSTHPNEFNLDSIVNISSSELSKLSSLKNPINTLLFFITKIKFCKNKIST